MYEIELNLNLDKTPCLHDNPFQNIYLSDVNETGFMCLTSPSIYSDHWKSFMKFGIKKSHEMISHAFAWIALSSGWKPMKSTKPWYLAQTTLLAFHKQEHRSFIHEIRLFGTCFWNIATYVYIHVCLYLLWCLCVMPSTLEGLYMSHVLGSSVSTDCFACFELTFHVLQMHV